MDNSVKKDDSQNENILTWVMNRYAGPIPLVITTVVASIIIAYMLTFLTGLIGLQKPPSIYHLLPFLVGQIIVVSFALWLKRKYGSNK